MFESYITTKDEAVCHLFLHCCFRDGTFSQEEIDNVSSKFVDLQIHRDLNFKEELQHYRTYQNGLEDETEYLRYLAKLITPVQDLALYSYCVELCLSDGLMSSTEELLLKRIAVILEIEEEQSTIDNLMIQRKAVELEKIF
ncbi:MAG TPA: TerB family tellurite resistance protein [Parafilimonas sp.]|nr:TerB family tellurite resistance protein [Parafilimonas sp.]